MTTYATLKLATIAAAVYAVAQLPAWASNVLADVAGRM